MNKIVCLLAALLIPAVDVAAACTKEEFKILDSEISEGQKKQLSEKLMQFDNYLHQLQIKKGMSDRELLLYRTNALNNPKAKKLQAKQRSTEYFDYVRLANEGDCETLKKWTDESMVSANRQWEIVFAQLESELK